jgi:hypothetical protein
MFCKDSSKWLPVAQEHNGEILFNKNMAENFWVSSSSCFLFEKMDGSLANLSSL